MWNNGIETIVYLETLGSVFKYGLYKSVTYNITV